MKYIYIILAIASLNLFFNSCKQEEKYDKSLVTLDTILSSFDNFWKYYYEHVNLSSDFVGIDEIGKKINKDLFMNKLVKGGFLPLKLQSLDSIEVYSLSPITELIDESIASTIKQMANIEMQDFQMENQYANDFKFEDITGKIYDLKKSAGKLVVLKCWFIHCMACIQEFSEINKFVTFHSADSNKIIYLGLAKDSKEELFKFLAKKPFQYNVIAQQSDYMKSLQVNLYPNHILINGDGKIVKVVNEFDRIVPFIEKELSKI